MYVDGDDVPDSSSNSALPAEDTLSAGLLATVDSIIMPFELLAICNFDCLHI